MKRRTVRKLGRPIGAISAMLMGSLTSACVGEPTTPPPLGVGLTTAADVTAGLVEHHRYHHHGGITLLIAMSLDTLSVSAAQQPAIDQVRATLRTAMAAARGSDDSLLRILADGVDAAHVDPAASDAAIAVIGEENAAVFAASVDALNALHSALSPPQRVALFDKVAWHWTIWQSATSDIARDNDWVATITDNLGLTAGQTDAVHAAFETRRRGAPVFDPNEITASLHSLSDAFQKTDFDARTLPAASLANQHMAIWGAEHLAYMVEAAVPVLHADQRARLAKTLREHASHPATADRGR